VNALLQVRQLTKLYGEQVALLDVAFDVREGEVLGVIGPNGSGKTTLLECVTGLQPADDGQVRWQGQLLPRGQRRRAMFYIPEGRLARLGDRLTITVNLAPEDPRCRRSMPGEPSAGAPTTAPGSRFD
jgi:ABC-type multidrug transport system ATPase subunit